MPESRNRHKHHHAPSPHIPSKPKRSAAFILAVLAAILGVAVAFFTPGSNAFWVIAGAVSGAVIGFLIGNNMDKTIKKNE